MELWGASPLDAMSHSRHFERSPYYESPAKERGVFRIRWHFSVSTSLTLPALH